MGSGLVEQETAAYLNLFVLSQLHLVEEIERELCSLFLVHLPSKTRALKIGYGDHIIMKLPGLLTMRADDNSVEEVADTCIVNLDRQTSMASCFDSELSMICRICSHVSRGVLCYTPPPFFRRKFLSGIDNGRVLQFRAGSEL